MKEQSKVKVEGKPVFYAVLYNNFRKAAIDCGYALSLHGSMARGMDLITVPWVEDAKPVEELIKAISDCIGNTVWSEHHFKDPEKRPHGRTVYTLSIMGDWFIDLSIMTREEFSLNIVNETAPDFANSVGISEERRIELSQGMDRMSASFVGQAIRTCNMFNEILHQCKNMNEVVYCVHVHTSWLFERGYMAYVK